MTDELDLEMLRKAILFECDNLLGKNKNQAHDRPRIFNQVTTFYHQLRDKFEYKISVEDYDSTVEEDKKIRKEQEKWIGENGIVSFLMNDSFYFTNEVDATAFKLRWK